MFGSFSFSAMFIFPVEICPVTHVSRPSIVQRKRGAGKHCIVTSFPCFAFNDVAHFHCVPHPSLPLCACLSFLPVLTTLPSLGMGMIFCIMWQQLPLAIPGTLSQVGPLALWHLPCCDLYCFSHSSWRGFPGRDPVPLEVTLLPQLQTVQHGKGPGAFW